MRPFVQGRERGWLSGKAPGPPNPGRTGLEGAGGGGYKDLAQSPEQKQLCYAPGLQEGQALQDGQGHRWLLWDQQGRWALALQGLPTQGEAGSQQEAI